MRETELAVGFVEQAGDVVGFRHVGLDGNGTAAAAADLGGDRIGAVGRGRVVDADVEAAHAREARDAGAYAPAAAGHDHDSPDSHVGPPRVSRVAASPKAHGLARSASATVSATPAAILRLRATR